MIRRVMEHIPAIKVVMTPFPYFVELTDPLSRAEEMMAEHGIRHLPVMDRGRLTGVLSHSAIVSSDAARGSGDAQVSDAHVSEVHTVDLSARLDKVLMDMAERHSEAVVVVKQDRLAGIFTMVDACLCFREFLHSIFPEKDGDDAA